MHNFLRRADVRGNPVNHETRVKLVAATNGYGYSNAYNN